MALDYVYKTEATAAQEEEVVEVVWVEEQDASQYTVHGTRARPHTTGGASGGTARVTSGLPFPSEIRVIDTPHMTPPHLADVR